MNSILKAISKVKSLIFIASMCLMGVYIDNVLIVSISVFFISLSEVYKKKLESEAKLERMLANYPPESKKLVIHTEMWNLSFSILCMFILTLGICLLSTQLIVPIFNLDEWYETVFFIFVANIGLCVVIAVMIYMLEWLACKFKTINLILNYFHSKVTELSDKKVHLAIKMAKLTV